MREENTVTPHQPMHRARAAVLWGLAGFVALQAGVELAMDHWLPQLRDPEYGAKLERLRSKLAETPRAFTIVMLGSSRTQSGLRAGQLERQLTRDLHCPVVVSNFGISGAGPFSELLHLRRLLGQRVRPNLLLIEVL